LWVVGARVAGGGGHRLARSVSPEKSIVSPKKSIASPEDSVASLAKSIASFAESIASPENERRVSRNARGPSRNGRGRSQTTRVSPKKSNVASDVRAVDSKRSEVPEHFGTARCTDSMRAFHFTRASCALRHVRLPRSVVCSTNRRVAFPNVQARRSVRRARRENARADRTVGSAGSNCNMVG
jgi:hypothetical protein